MIKHIDWKFLIIGIIAGFIIIYTYNGDKKEIVKFPHPDTAGKLVYKDNNNTCYTFKVKEVDCEKVADKMIPYPFQD